MPFTLATAYFRGSNKYDRSVVYQDDAGNSDVRTGGDRAWRNNNPGNIKDGPFARSHGEIGIDPDGFAIFPDGDTGNAAKAALLTSTNTYNNGDITIHDMLLKYTEDNVAGYEQFLIQQGWDTSSTINDVNNAGQLQNLLDNMARFEGQRPGNLVNIDSSGNVTTNGITDPRDGGLTLTDQVPYDKALILVADVSTQFADLTNANQNTLPANVEVEFSSDSGFSADIGEDGTVDVTAGGTDGGSVDGVDVPPDPPPIAGLDREVVVQVVIR